jgi:hypothetical protein
VWDHFPPFSRNAWAVSHSITRAPKCSIGTYLSLGMLGYVQLAVTEQPYHAQTLLKSLFLRFHLKRVESSLPKDELGRCARSCKPSFHHCNMVNHVSSSVNDAPELSYQVFKQQTNALAADCHLQQFPTRTPVNQQPVVLPSPYVASFHAQASGAEDPLLLKGALCTGSGRRTAALLVEDGKDSQYRPTTFKIVIVSRKVFESAFERASDLGCWSKCTEDIRS